MRALVPTFAIILFGLYGKFSIMLILWALKMQLLSFMLEGENQEYIILLKNILLKFYVFFIMKEVINERMMIEINFL